MTQRTDSCLLDWFVGVCFVSVLSVFRFQWRGSPGKCVLCFAWCPTKAPACQSKWVVAAVGVSALGAIQVPWSGRQSSWASRRGCLAESRILSSRIVALDANSQMQVKLFKAPNIMFMFSLRLASEQERKVNHWLVYFDLKIQYHSFAVSGLSDKIS